MKQEEKHGLSACVRGYFKFFNGLAVSFARNQQVEISFS